LGKKRLGILRGLAVYWLVWEKLMVCGYSLALAMSCAALPLASVKPSYEHSPALAKLSEFRRPNLIREENSEQRTNSKMSLDAEENLWKES